MRGSAVSRHLFSRVIHTLLLVALLVTPDLLSPRSASLADVGELPAEGGLVTPGDKTDQIRMKSEKVVFSVRPNDGTFLLPEAQYYAHVTADFVMQNLSSVAVSKELFFPFHSFFGLEPYQDPAYADLRQAENAQVLVDDREVQLRYTEVAFSLQEKRVAVAFSVRFPAGRDTAIRVEYDVRAVQEAKISLLGFRYMMQTGSHWAGTIGSGQVIFEFWQPVNNKSAFAQANDFFQAIDGRLEWDFTDLEPTPDHDISVSFEPTALEAWAGRPAYVKDIQTSSLAALRVPDAACLRTVCDMIGYWWFPTPAYLLDTAGAERGWVIEQVEDSGEAWLQLDLDQAHTLAGLLIRTGVLEQVWRSRSDVVDTWDTYRRPKTVVVALSGGETRTVSLADTPAEWQTIPLPSIPTSSIWLSFPDAYAGTFKGDAYLGIGRIQLLGVDGGLTAQAPGACTGPNLLHNGSFEAGFDGGVGLGWGAFHSEGGAVYGFQDDQWPPVVYEGSHSQLVAIGSDGIPPEPDRSAGIYQTLTGLEPGVEYELSLAGLLREEASHPGEDAYRYRVQGALAAGADWTHVPEWQDLPGDTLYLRTEPGAFSTTSVCLFAPGESATLFIRAWKKWATSGRELDASLDAITLRKCEPQPFCRSWDLAEDLRLYPGQENPNGDSCGNRAVWRFLQRADGWPDILLYQPLPSFNAKALGIPGLQQWAGYTIAGSPLDRLPAIGINSTDQTQSYSTLAWPPHTIRVHPADVPAVVGWRSPVSGRVRISGLVSDMDPNCGNGVLWSIELGTRTLASGSLGSGETQRLADGQGGASLASVPVSQGELLYFVVDANGEMGCDSTELEIRIERVSRG